MTDKTKTETETKEVVKKIELAAEIQLQTGGEARTIKMSFGLLNRICQIVGDAEGVILISTDPVLQNRILLELLAERDEDGLITRAPDVDKYELERDDVLLILKWACDHSLDFFLGALEMGQNLQKTHQDRISALQAGSTGSPS